MKRVTSIATACATAVLLAVTMSVSAQDLNTQERTYLTFSGPVQLPGMTLQPGTYTFRLADSPSRNVVQVLSQDEQEIFGQFLFVQKPRMDVSGETVVTFREMPAGMTPAVQYWFYPGEKIGKEFIYPKDQALRIARVTGQTVLTEEGPVSAQSEVSAAIEAAETPSASASVSEPPTETQFQQSAIAETEPSPAELSQAQAGVEVSTNPVIDSTQETIEGAVGTTGELPRTASPLVFSGLLGLLSLAGALGLRAARR